jgi:Protein of unknown function (DUF3592)
MKSKIATILFALVFALAFGAGGLFGVTSLVNHVWGGIRASTWQPVTAIVTEASLERSGDGSDAGSNRVQARYNYEIGGKRYDGTRVGLVDGGDNIGDWQQAQFARLAGARQSGQPIQIWVDPNSPERAIVNRDIRWGLVLFMIPFAVLFPLISLGASWVIYRTVRAPAESSTAPAILRNNAREIASDSRANLKALWLGGILWSLIAFPIGFLFVSNHSILSPLAFFVAFFQLIGVALLWGAIRQTLNLYRHGDVTITLQPAEPSIGNTVLVSARFQRTPPTGAYTVTLLCERVDSTSDSTDYKTVWRQERIVNAGTSGTEASFLPRVNTPASQPEGPVHHRWRVLLRFPDRRDERAFDIVMRPARAGFVEGASTDTPTAAASTVTADVIAEDSAAQPIPASIASIRETMNSLTVAFGTTNMRNTGWIMLVFGLVFVGVAAFLARGEPASSMIVPKIMSAIFGVIGVLIIGGGVHYCTHRRTVEIVGRNVRVRDTSVFKTTENAFSADEVTRLTSTIIGTTTIGRNRYDHHEISAQLRDGRMIPLASDVRELGVAQAFRQLFQRRLAIFASLSEPAVAISTVSAVEMDNRAAVTNGRILVRNRRWMRHGVKVLGALMVAAILWDFVSPFFRR